MVEAQLNYFDMIVIGVMFLSCVFAFFRGFVREILSLIAWVGACFVTIYYLPSMKEILAPHFNKPAATIVVSTGILYVGSLLGFSIFNRFIIKILKSGSGISFLDNLLGFIFGALRGALIVSIGYFVLTLVIPENKYPDWLTQASTKPYVEAGASLLKKIAPSELGEISNLGEKAGEIKELPAAKVIDGNLENMKNITNSIHDVEIKNEIEKEKTQNVSGQLPNKVKGSVSDDDLKNFDSMIHSAPTN